jgi:hypothetical protein
MPALRERAIQMRVAAIDEKKLAGDVRRQWAGEKQNGGGNFFRRRQALAERNHLFNYRSRFRRIRLGFKPALILRRDALGGNDGVDANSVGRERRGPFPREREHAAFRRGVAGGMALPRYGHFGTDIHDRAARFLQGVEGEVSDSEDVKQILLQRGHEIGRRLLQSNAVVHASIVDQNIEPTECSQRFQDATLTVSFHGQVSGDELNGHVRLKQFSSKTLPTRFIAIRESDTYTFTRERSHYGSANARGAARDERNFVFQPGVHVWNLSEK